jgi:tRNA 2-selenouridine synthase
MRDYPLVWLEDSFENRVQRILQDYVINLSAEFLQAHGPDAGAHLFAAQLRQSLHNISRRLGMQRYQSLADLMDEALRQQLETGDTERHRAWIEVLLKEYYDPMYAYQRQEKSERIVFSGDHAAVSEYLRASATT